MQKLINKKDPSGTVKNPVSPLSLESISKAIRNETRIEKEVIKESKDTLNNVEVVEKKKINENLLNIDSPVISQLMAELSTKDYSCKSILYVDEEVKEIFALLKQRGKIPISGLISLILEKWVMENLDEINAIIQKENRFL